ncbi:carbon-nitrogen hydrolase family protein [Nitrosophilus kaiyonis]|uniref:carbon-nitrogen hydrolase family protein n=1 Tax=Nitrosophilus kaiyonis TaxID=2930200 RepID=UPI0024937B54|nr:carbon-nitrogen hydrolase family protein [Nitrosophilus kaiyonis]
MTSKNLCSLQFKTSENFEKNLLVLKNLIKSTPKNSIIVAPEVCLTGFAYDRFDEAANFSKQAIKEILPLTDNKIVTFTTIEKKEDGFYNIAKVIYKKEIVYEQPKVKLFKFGGETEYFEAGSLDDIKIFEIDGIKFGLLICFELRFLEIWQRLKGADIILVPAMWGKLRKKHFEQFTEALAVMNQCFVIASDSANDDMAKSSAIISPFGEVFRDDRLVKLCKNCDLNEIRKMRRYMDIGL